MFTLPAPVAGTTFVVTTPATTTGDVAACDPALGSPVNLSGQLTATGAGTCVVSGAIVIDPSASATSAPAILNLDVSPSPYDATAGFSIGATMVTGGFDATGYSALPGTSVPASFTVTSDGATPRWYRQHRHSD